MRTWKGTVLVSMIALFAGGPVAHGQESGVRFNLSTPGARSLAMGGAFLGLADDATAAYTNPAGLTNLALGGPEIAVEVRQWKYSTLFVEKGKDPFHLLTNSAAGVIESNATSSSVASDANGLSFLSFGYVLPHGLTVALYQHQLANFANDAVRQGLFLPSVNPQSGRVDCTQGPITRDGSSFDRCRLQTGRERNRYGIDNGGMSLAYRPTSGRLSSLSVGVGISYYRSDVRRQRDTYYFAPFTGDLLTDRRPGNFAGPLDLAADNIVAADRIDISDNAIGGNLGVLWKAGANQRWSLGGVYRRGPRFKGEETLSAGPGIWHTNGDFVAGDEIARITARLRIPDVFGLGVAFSGDEGKLKIGMDLDRLRYSQQLASGQRGFFKIEDTNEIHLGLERVFLAVESQLVGTFRLGAWNEPNHEPVGKGPLVILFPEQKGQIHWTGGLGLVFKEDYQLDAAVDVSDRAKILSISIVRFL